MSNKESSERKNTSISTIIKNTETFIDVNQKKILTVVSVIAILVLAGFLIHRFYLKPRAVQAQEEIFPSEVWFSVDSLNQALNGDGKHLGFIDIASEYSSTKAGNLAKYYIGICFLRQGKFNDAISYLEDYDPKDIMTAPLCKMLLGDAHLELGNIDEALKYYTEAAKTNENELTTPAALLKVGQVYEMKNDYASAITAYKAIKKDYPFSAEAREIDKYISYVETLAKK